MEELGNSLNMGKTDLINCDGITDSHFLKDFIYLFTRDTEREREREAETQAEREAGSM